MNARPRIAFFDFTGCEGCQLTVLDALQTDFELLEAVEIVQFREAMSEREAGYQIAFVEGSVAQPADVERLQAIRARADLVVALGACAHLGGVNALRNRRPLDQARQIVYGDFGKVHKSTPAVQPISAVITVDAVIPGCPISRDEFVRVTLQLLQGRQPQLPGAPVCAECKLRENACVVWRGEPCLGPITRAGCDAICPAYGQGCMGCRGLAGEPNGAWLEAALSQHGVDQAAYESLCNLFLSSQLAEVEAD